MYKLDLHRGIEVYVDADFAGLYGREPATNPVSAKS